VQKKIRGSAISEELIQEILMPKDMFSKRIKSFSQVINVTLYHFYITGEIDDDVEPYIDMVNTLKTAEEHDQIFIYLNTPGGSVSTTIQIISAMKQSIATITTVVEGDVCSAGTLIFLSGDHYVVNDHCTLMIHNYSHGPYGKGNEVKSQVNYSDKYFNKLAHDFYKNFLTEEEINAVCEDKDFWMESDEIRDRLKRNGIPVKRSIREVEEEIFNNSTNDEVIEEDVTVVTEDISVEDEQPTKTRKPRSKAQK